MLMMVRPSMSTFRYNCFHLGSKYRVRCRSCSCSCSFLFFLFFCVKERIYQNSRISYVPCVMRM